MIFSLELINSVAEAAEKIDDMVTDCCYARKSAQIKKMTIQSNEFKKEFRANWVPPVPAAHNDTEARARLLCMKAKIAWFTKLAMEIGRLDIAEDLIHVENGLDSAEANLPTNVMNFGPVCALGVARTQPCPGLGLAA